MHIETQTLRVSIVIPVYNEADTIGACLDAIAAQTIAPYEVIVVDNNSVDDTRAVAALYPFARIIDEPRQGVVYARDAGFDAADGDIIGRIDADTIMDPDWVENLCRIFYDGSVDVVSGSARYHDMVCAEVFNSLDPKVRAYLAAVLGREVAIQGANMALRRRVWSDITAHLCRTAGIHEDYDVGIHANWRGYKVVYDASLVVTLSFRQARSCFKAYRAYLLLSPQTYHFHGLKSARRMYPIVWLATLLYIPITMLHRSCDTATGRFSLQKLLGTVGPVRVNPGTYVD